MIPILYEKDEAGFDNNGLGRLRDMISCIVTEERNGIYECDFEYPLTAEDFKQIQIGRIIGVTHDESGDIEPFDIVSYERPINGIVTFHCTHISYRQSYLTVTGSGIQSLADAFTLLGGATPQNPFTYQTDKSTVAYMSGADGKPHTVRSLLGGTEGSILDTYGGEYEWNKFTVILHNQRGVQRDFKIRYGVNMTDYKEDTGSEGTYQSVIPYWTDGTTTIIGDKQTGSQSTVTGRDDTIPLDVSDKFESQPTKAQVEAMGLSVLNSRNTALPTQTISVSFIRLQDVGEFGAFSRLLSCNLCDTIGVIFPDYGQEGQFKIVKTVWNVLKDRYDSMELGDLSATLSEALGITNGLGGGGSASGSDIPRGGSTGQVLAKASNTDYDVAWISLGGDWTQVGSATAGGNLNLTKNISNYKFIAWYLINTSTNAVEGFFYAPVSVFKQYTTTSMAMGINAYNGGRQYAYLNYLNDTKVNVQLSSGRGIAVWLIS